MKYRIKLVNDFDAAYYLKDGSHEICRSIDSQEYETESKMLAETIIRDLMDAPEKELSMDDVRKDFCSPGLDVKEENLAAIREYYNGRLVMLGKVISDFESLTPGLSVKHPIPYEYNHFSVTEDPPPGEKQRDAYIEIACE